MLSRWRKGFNRGATAAVTVAWSLTVQGQLTALSRVDVDQSGKNPRYLIYGTLDVQNYELEGARFDVPATLQFQGAEADFDSEPELNQRLELHFSGQETPVGRWMVSPSR
ncbi:hypothetical protein BGP77_02950 [Saccharospirillum sp. MSK14-1]|uniref:hypothetical protein n=1 Tax=Saccharospirillum sp. MSK14-1 TaxID=1897632 RepID=UPI000D3A5813|nr:hypothetical protein [Saccharospirillum sp. MSK14-1]PTY36285.1 hypothetical protein BGP77_02950 [Saccharospirillum sp. MSK14-1]